MFNPYSMQKQVHSASPVRAESVAGFHSFRMISSTIRDTERVWDGQENEWILFFVNFENLLI